MESDRMRLPKVYISILNWNGLDDTIECLESIFDLDYNNYHIVLVDNNSSDNSVPVLRERYPQIHLIENKINTGFAGGNNIAINYAMKNGADYVWLLNNDTIVDTSCLKCLVEQGEKTSIIGMISPVIYYYDARSKKQFSGSLVDLIDLKIEYPDLANEIEDKYFAGSNVCLWGTALLIKAGLINKIGLLKEEYFAYWEDTEYSLRSIKAGYQNVVSPVSVIWHKTPIDKTRKSNHYHYYMVRNKSLMLEEHSNITNRNVFYRKQLAELIMDVGRLIRESATEYAEARINGYWHAFRHVSGPLKEYHNPIFRSIIMLLSKKYPYFIANILLGNWELLLIQISNLRFLKKFVPRVVVNSLKDKK